MQQVLKQIDLCEGWQVGHGVQGRGPGNTQAPVASRPAALLFHSVKWEGLTNDTIGSFRYQRSKHSALPLEGT